MLQFVKATTDEYHSGYMTMGATKWLLALDSLNQPEILCTEDFKLIEGEAFCCSLYKRPLMNRTVVY